MSKRVSSSEQDGVMYRRAKLWQIALSQLCTAAPMCFYVLMGYATYIGNSGYGILVAVTGVIMTASRIFDGITDPVCAFIIERVNTRFGKIRIFLLIGWGIMALATTAMCNWGAGHLSGVSGLVFFIVCYMVYIVGYTLAGIAMSMVGPVMTNDPKQRPALSVWSTIYSYLTPMVISMVSMTVILPKCDNVIDIPFLSSLNLLVVSVAFVFEVLSCVGMAEFDKPENFAGISNGKGEEEKVSFQDMWSLIKDNKELQRYMIAACSDKLTQTIGGAAVVTTMLFGILIGNMSISTVISTVAMLPSIIFAIIGARLAGKHGNKKTMVTWTWVCIGVNAIFALFLLFSDTTKITVAIVPSAIFFLLMFGDRATKMVVSTATTAMRMDVIDYELHRTGKYMPAVVSATYSFIDKFISAFGATIATALIGIIGYTSTAPQQGDPLTTGVRIMTVVLYCGFPILGWVCTLLSMKNCTLSREKMIEVQKSIAEKKAAAK
ncbi:MAG: MFS transporter [Eubacteriales bacterium]|nr:MFS transporter [Eubacteriales bacterium]